ncbi:MAG TPA: hypothetical protein VGG00_07175 [Rhodanobacter sp.]|jgi:hypothetical protein
MYWSTESSSVLPSPSITLPSKQVTLDVAQLLGYSEHSALTRSYRQWTGLTPQRWRESTGPWKAPPA